MNPAFDIDCTPYTLVGTPSSSIESSHLADRRPRNLRIVLLSMLFVMLAALSLSRPALGQTETAYNLARSFLDTRQSASSILDFVHFGADYRGHQFLHATQVVDRNNNVIAGEFALVYRYYWADDGKTDLTFFCSPSGQILEARVTSTNAVWNQPFALANLSIQVVGRMVVNSDHNMSDEDRKEIIELVDRADAQGLLNLWLRMQ